MEYQKNKTALITGGSSGIGFEMAKLHASLEGNLILVARKLDELKSAQKKLVDEYSVKVEIIEMDLSDVNSAQKIYDKVQKMNLKVDYLINNAGFGGQGAFVERNWEVDHAMINVNVIAVCSLTRLFLPDFLKRDSGKILNTASTVAFIPGPLQAVYYASKAFARSFSNALSYEVHNSNVTVTALLPGATETGFAKVGGLDKTDFFKTGTGASAKKVASDGYRAMLDGKIEVISGLPLSQRIIMKLSELLPRKVILKTIYNGQISKNK